MLRAVRFLSAASLAVAVFFCLAVAGCSKPSVPSLVGSNMFHDITQIRKGMSANEVRRIMGSNYKSVWEEGIRGADGGNQTWVYPEGKVYFDYDGVTSVEPK